MNRQDFEDIAKQLQQIDKEEQLNVKRAQIAKIKKREKICSNLAKVFNACEILGLMVAAGAAIYCFVQKPSLDSIDQGQYKFMEDYIESEGSQQEKEIFKKFHGGVKAVESAVIAGLASGFCAGASSIYKHKNKEKRETLESSLDDTNENFAVVFPDLEK